MYRYYHYPSGKEILSKRKLNQLELDKYFNLEESYQDFEQHLADLSPDAEKEIKFSRAKFRKWLEKQPLVNILINNEIEVTKVKVKL